jgi:hypothetical protein
MQVYGAKALKVFFVLCVLAQAVCSENKRTHDAVLADGLDLTAFGGRVSLCASPLTSDNNICTCAAGWTAIGGTCVMCAAGLFKPRPGFAACTACPAHMTSFEGSVELGECLCAAGYTPAAGVCVPCATTTYKPFVGNNSCVSCPAITHTVSSGAIDIDDCLCDSGWTLTDDGCVACPEHHFSNPLTAGSCWPCTPDSGSGAQASLCQCNAGYAREGSACAACVAGTYKTARDESMCEQCPAHMSSPLADLRVFITNVKGTFLGMSESEEASRRR